MAIKRPLDHERLRQDLTAFIAHMHSSSEPLVAVLKGHLAVEDAIKQLIEQEVQAPEHLSNVRLTFDQRVSLGHALTGTAVPTWAWAGARKLNTIRNKFAHRMAPSNADALVAELVRFVDEEWARGFPSETAVTRSQAFPTPLEGAITVILIPLLTELRTVKQKPTLAVEDVIEVFESVFRGQQDGRGLVPPSSNDGGQFAVPKAKS
jgi:hypothetical protein